MPVAKAAAKLERLPIGLQLWSVRHAIREDPEDVFQKLKGFGFDGVEFDPSYFDWPTSYIRQIRRALDASGLICMGTSGVASILLPYNLSRVAELNHILGSSSVAVADFRDLLESETNDAWLSVADTLERAAAILGGNDMTVSVENHLTEFQPVKDGALPIDIIVSRTSPRIQIELDIANCLAAGGVPLDFVHRHPGRVQSMHVKDWSPDPAVGWSALLGEGIADWGAILAMENLKMAGVRRLFVEQERPRIPEMDAVQTDLTTLQSFLHRG